jgi:hypothetical protein
MRRTLSSSVQTFFMKWVFPTLWIGGFGLGTCDLWMRTFDDLHGVQPFETLKWGVLAGWLGGSSFIIWSYGRLKRVQVDDEALYVSNCWSKVRIPLAEVSHFTQSYMFRPSTVTIHLRSLSLVGQRIVFIPSFRWVLFGTYPTITELQALCDRAKANEGIDDQGHAILGMDHKARICQEPSEDAEPNPYKSPRIVSFGTNPCVEEPQMRGLVFMSLVLAVVIEVLPVETDFTMVAASLGNMSQFILAKATCLATILGPLFIYLALNGWRGVKAVKGMIIGIVVVVVFRLVLDASCVVNCLGRK